MPCPRRMVRRPEPWRAGRAGPRRHPRPRLHRHRPNGCRGTRHRHGTTAGLSGGRRRPRRGVASTPARRLAAGGCGCRAGRSGRRGSAASARPCSIGTRISSRAWITSVGARTRVASSSTSIPYQRTSTRPRSRPTSCGGGAPRTSPTAGRGVRDERRREEAPDETLVAAPSEAAISTCSSASRRSVSLRRPAGSGRGGTTPHEHEMADTRSGWRPRNVSTPRRRPATRRAARTDRARGRRPPPRGRAPRRRTTGSPSRGPRGRSRARRTGSACGCATGPTSQCRHTGLCRS